MTDIKIFGTADERTLTQIERCVAAEEGARGALMADNHLGYSMPIGGVVAYREHVCPAGVGYDIGCGNKAVLTNVLLEDLRPGDVASLMDYIFERVSFGMGRKNNEPVDHPVLDKIREAEFEPQRALLDTAAAQLGTVGAGNHYVDLFHDEQDRIWVGVHFGSRGFGHKTASGFLAMAQGKSFDDKGKQGEMEAPPDLLSMRSDLGQAYVAAMKLAGEYAYAGRDVVCDKVLEILDAKALDEVHNHHNFAWQEDHDGETFWVVRKGATPAWPGQRGFVGSTMGEQSVIIEGSENPEKQGYLNYDAVLDQMDALYSTVHGAGRVMSRTQAAGKSGKRATCSDRDCDFNVSWKQYVAENVRCPQHPSNKMMKRFMRYAQGAIDFDQVRQELVARGIELRGGAADEAPGAYKRLPEVLAAHGDTIRVLHMLTPIGVAMAGPDTRDDYKD